MFLYILQLVFFRRQTIAAFCSGALGALAFFLLYSELLNPTVANWILWIGGDPFQHYIGWEMFRNSAWTFPLGSNPYLSYPTGIPVTFTDSIPLLAIFLKLFRQWLPYPFQYDGIWILLCFVLQGVFGYAVASRVLKKYSLAVLASIFFVLSPIMLFRLGGHFALGAHWLILWCIFLATDKNGKTRLAQWMTILALSITIHPYFVFMNMPIFVADTARRAWVTRSISKKQAYLYVGMAISLVLILAYCIGVFSVSNPSAPGYGVFSLDLNSLFNPDGWSTIIADMGVRKPNEGFQYLGLGIIILAILSVYEFVKARTGESLRTELRVMYKEWWPIIISAVFLFLVAVTNTVSLCGQTLLHIPLPNFLQNHVLGIVRSSGRLFWPIYYAIILATLFVVREARPRLAYIIVIFAVCVQLYDIHWALRSADKFYENRHWSSPLQDPFWAKVSNRYEHISFLPPVVAEQFEPIAYYAGKFGLTVNMGYSARPVDGGNTPLIKKEKEAVCNGMVDSSTLYIFYNIESAKDCLKNMGKQNFKILSVDGYTVLAP